MMAPPRRDNPYHSSAGWYGEPWPAYLKPKKEDIVEYKTDLPLDNDIRDSVGHMES